MDTTQPVMQSQPVPSMQTPVQTPPKVKKRILPVILLFMGIVILVAGITFGAMFFFMKSQQKISFAPPFPKVSPMPTSPLTPSPKATTSATPT